jgi:prevent-host-death family protein
MTVGIRELKDNLSQYVRKVEAGARVSVTANGRVVAELVPAAGGARGRAGSRFEALVEAGLVVPAAESGDPTEGWPTIRLKPGTARALIDEDRGDA